jgi:hypothetical protein
MHFINHFRPFLELGRCKEYVMASKTTETSKKRNRKGAPVQPPAPTETRPDLTLVSRPAVGSIEEEIRRRAYELYLERGSTPGDPGKDWLIAEQEVRSRQMQKAG